MPRIHTVKARKDYPAEGIAKGDTYFKWSTRFTVGKSYMKRTHRSKTRPRASQLTGSEYLSQAHQLNERIEDFDDIPSMEEFIDELKGDAENLRDETQEKLDAMPEQFQEGATGELLNERVEALDAFIDELDSLDIPEAFEEPEPEQEDGEDDDDFADRYEEWEDERDARETEQTEALENLKNISLEVG